MNGDMLKGLDSVFDTMSNFQGRRQFCTYSTGVEIYERDDEQTRSDAA